MCHNQILLLYSRWLSCLLCWRMFLMVQSKALAYFLHHVSRAAGWLASQDGAKVRGLWWCKIHTGRRWNMWEKEECRKGMGINCPRVFLEAPACLTHNFSSRGPICSGIIRISSWWEHKRDRKWKRIHRHQRRIPGIWHICRLRLSLHRCRSHGIRAAQSEGPLYCFWTSHCIVHAFPCSGAQFAVASY